MGRWLHGALLAAALATLPARLALADVTPREAAAAADKLFRSGRAAFKRGDFASACSDFAESQRLDPAAGTALNLSECEEKIGRVATAWRHLREAIDLLKPGDERLAVARERLPQLEKRIPRLIVRGRTEARQGTTVLLDGADIPPASFDIPQPVDPGEHVLTVRAPNRTDAIIRVNVAEGETRTADVSQTTDPRTPVGGPESTATAVGTPRRTVAYFVGGSRTPSSPRPISRRSSATARTSSVTSRTRRSAKDPPTQSRSPRRTSRSGGSSRPSRSRSRSIARCSAA